MEIGDNKTENLPQHVQVPHGLCKGKINYQILGLYAHLRRYMNGNTYSTFVSLRTLKQDTGISIPTIQKYLNILEEEGHIQIRKRSNGSNIYKFNTDSELYKRGFEMFTFEFMSDKNIPFNEKCALIAFQEKMMNKESGIGCISSTSMEMSTTLNASISTYKRLEKSLIDNGWLSIAKTRAKDMDSGSYKNLYSFDLEILGQAILYNQEKIKEHDKDIQELKEENLYLKKEMENMKHQLRILNSNLNTKNKEELESKNISINIV